MAYYFNSYFINVISNLMSNVVNNNNFNDPIKHNTIYSLDDREDQNYKENERSLKPTGMYLRRL